MDPFKRSPVNWIGGKFFSAERIVAAFPPADAYDVYCEPFGGGAHVMFAKPEYGHLEVYNDLFSDLVTFWLVARDRREELQARMRSLPYSRELFYRYHKMMRAGGADAITDPLERAVLWFYVQRSGIAGTGTTRVSCPGWGYTKAPHAHHQTHAFQSAIDLLDYVQERFRQVQIDNRDFAKIITTYQHKRALFYCDPPYLDAEVYYKGSIGAFDREDHGRLAALLNATPAMVALSYYDHPEVDSFYPPDKWRKMRWSSWKMSDKKNDGAARQMSHELLLMNYPATRGGLWERLGAETALPDAAIRESEELFVLEEDDGTGAGIVPDPCGEEEEEFNIWTI